MGLSDKPIITFLAASLMVYLIIKRHRIDRKAVVTTYLSGGIACLLITILNLNNVFFILPKIVTEIMNIAACILSALTIILILYISLTNKNKKPPGKLPKL